MLSSETVLHYYFFYPVSAFRVHHFQLQTMPNPLLDLGILSICYIDVHRFHTGLHLFQYRIHISFCPHLRLTMLCQLSTVLFMFVYLFLLSVVTFSYNEFISDISNSGNISRSET